MIWRRTLIELLHLVIGIAGAAVLAYGAVWSLPHAHDTIWAVTYGVMAVVVVMSLRPIVAAAKADRRSTDG
jgi:predicted membrane channel-forming protein YqfA (hemolysin III family)